VSLDKSQLSAFVNGVGAATDTAVVAAVPGRAIRVIGGYVSAGAAVSSVQFNTKPAGAGTAIAGLINLAVSGTVVLSPDARYCQTNSGEGLTVTTVGTGPASVHVIYQLVS
jgi:hypothetical protein